MHPAVKLYLIKHEEELRRRGQGPLNGLAIQFLDQVWGPAFDYRFEGLTPEYPFRDFCSKQRFADFRYDDGRAITVIELDGYTTHARDISSDEFDDHITRQNDLLIKGCHLLRFTSGLLIQKPEVCQSQLVQAIGAWHYIRLNGYGAEIKDLWERRKGLVTLIANQYGGCIRPIDLAAQSGIGRHTAARWLKQLADEGYVEPAGGGKRVTGYRLRRTQ